MKLKLLEKLGNGGFADVWSARDDELEREVAVKIIREASLEVSDALAHAKALARASHPNVVAVFDIARIQDPDTDAEVDCVIMELLQGVTLAGRLVSEELSLSEALSIGIGIINGLSHIHTQGMTHGDLHEENVMVVGGTSKVIDILYLDSLALLSTQKQDAKFKRDLRNLRDLLQQLVIRTGIDSTRATEFINLGAGASIDDMRAAFMQTLSPANANKEVLHSNELGSNIRPYLLGMDRPGQNLRRLFEAHDVTPTNATSALNSYGINRAIYSSTSDLSNAAGKELIQYVARQFAVSGDWIDGQSSHIYCGGVDNEKSTEWRRSLRGAYDFIKRICTNQEELDLIIPAELTLSKLDELPDVVDIHSTSYENFYVAARKKNDFLEECFRLVINDPLTYRPCRDGIFFLFMAAELYEIETGCKTYLNVRVARRDDILSCQFGDLFLVDLFRVGSLVRNHKDFIYYDGAKLIATADVPSRLAEMLQQNLTQFVAHRSTALPKTIEFT